MDQLITRTLTFRSKDLGIDSTLILTFDDEKLPGIYKTVFPTVFKLTTFGKTGPYEFRIKFKSEIGFTRAQIEDETIASASTYSPIMKAGEKTILTKSGNPAVYSFSKPVSIELATDAMQAQNGTDEAESIGIGIFARPDRGPVQLLVFDGIGAGSSAVQSGKFIPLLRGYITSDHKENLVLTSPISSPRLFSENLLDLPPETNWKVEYNPGTHVYVIKRDLSHYEVDD